MKKIKMFDSKNVFDTGIHTKLCFISLLKIRSQLHYKNYTLRIKMLDFQKFKVALDSQEVGETIQLNIKAIQISKSKN